VTFTAFIDTKCLFAVVAEAAGFALFHFGHADRGVFAGFVQLGVAGSTVLYLGQVLVVAERRWSGLFNLIDNLFYLVALAAFMGIKGLLAVVTGSTRLPLVHISHGVMFFTFVTGVTGGTTEGWCAPLTLLGQVLVVAEYHLAGLFGIVVDIF